MNDLKRRIGGEDGITFSGWALLIPWSIYFALGYAPNRTPHSLPKWLLTGVLAHVATGIFLYICKTLFLRNSSEKSRPFTTFTIFIFAGIVRGFSVGAISVTLHASTKGNFGPRISAAIIATPLWFGMAALVINSVREHQRKTRELLHKQAELEESKAGYLSQIAEYRLATQAKIKEVIASAVEQAKSAPDLATGLIAASMEIVRPVSHSLAREEMTLNPPLVSIQDNARTKRGWRPLLQEVATRGAFPVGKLTLIIFLTPLPTFTRALGLLKGLALAISATLLYALIQCFIGKVSYSWRLRRPIGISFLYVLATWILSAYIPGILTVYAFKNLLGLSTTWLSVFILIFLTSVFGSLHRSASTLRLEAEAELSAAVRSLEWEARRAAVMAKYEQDKFAQIVHGSVQSLFTATALKLNINPESSDVVIDELVMKLRDVLDREPTDKNIFEGLASIKAVWEGVAEIQIDCDVVDNQIDIYAAFGILNIAREAFSNAVRHGKATHIQLKVASAHDALEVVIVDDGRLLKSRSLGLGSEILSRYTKDWKLTREDGQTVLRALIPAVK